MVYKLPDRRIEFIVNHRDYTKIKAAAVIDGANMSQWIRIRIVPAANKIVAEQEARRVLREQGMR